MGVANPAIDANNAVQALVNSLLGAFDATRDLYQTLKVKEKRDYELSLRTKGYPSSRRLEYVEDGSLGTVEDLVMDQAAVTRQFEIGYQKIGTQFAEGDVISQVGLQSQIIALQNVIVTIFLYGPTSTESISHQLENLSAVSRAASTSAVDILANQYHRQQVQLSQTSRSSHSPTRPSNQSQAIPYAVTTHGTKSASTSLVRYQELTQGRSSSPVNTTILEWRGRPKPERTDTDTTSMTGPTSYGVKSPNHDFFCLYAIDLQRHRSQELSASITSDPVPCCPHCKRTLHLSPGKAWEVCKNEDGYERRFQISNRFVVKCHRGGADGQYTCVLCSEHTNQYSVCGDVKALIKHIWEDHDIAELKHEEDITEVVEFAVDRRRDSGIGYSTSRSSRRSASLGPSNHSRRGRPVYEY